jgi:hypothetical protein
MIARDRNQLAMARRRDGTDSDAKDRVRVLHIINDHVEMLLTGNDKWKYRQRQQVERYCAEIDIKLQSHQTIQIHNTAIPSRTHRESQIRDSNSLKLANLLRGDFLNDPLDFSSRYHRESRIRELDSPRS